MLKELFAQLEQRRNDRIAAFPDLARKLAEGKVDTATVERVLTEVGKSPADLEAAVAMHTQRLAWAEQYRQCPALEKEQAKLREQVAVEDRKLDEAEKAHERATGPLYARLDEIKAAINDAGEAKRRLIQTCEGGSMKAELENVTRQREAVFSRLTALRGKSNLVKQAESDEEVANRWEHRILPDGGSGRAGYWRDQAALHRKAGEEAKAAIPAAQKEFEDLQQEEALIYERMTRP